LKRRAAAWRMANVDALRNLLYDSFAITRGRHRRLRYTTMSGRIDVILSSMFPGSSIDVKTFFNVFILFFYVFVPF